MTAMAVRTSARSERELLAGCTERTPLLNADGLSAVPMERVTLDGERYVVKWLSPELDWVMRFSDDDVCRAVVMWESGLYDAVAPYVEHAVVGACRDDSTGRAAVLMRDLGAWFVPEGATPFSLRQQDAFLSAMASLHAGFWGWRDVHGLCRDDQRIGLFSEAHVVRERRRGPLTGVPAVVLGGWAALHERAPRAAELTRTLVDDPAPLAAALAQTPRTLIHTDWKGGNLGLLPSGRTVLVDWAFPGEGAGCSDLAWYLAVNCDRLPTSKEQAIRTYRDALEARGVATAGWFDRQLELALLMAFCMLGWSKTEEQGELDWWADRVVPVAADLLG